MDSGLAARRLNQGNDGPGPDAGLGWRSWFVPARSIRFAQTVAAVTFGVAVAWLLLIVAYQRLRFVVYAPDAKSGFDIFLSVGLLFSAFVLTVSPVRSVQWRMKWVGSGLLVLGLGTIVNGYLYPMFAQSLGLMASMYQSLHVRGLATSLCAIGLLLHQDIRMSVRAIAIVGVVLTVAGFLLIPLSDRLPSLIHVTDDIAALQGDAVSGERVSPYDLEVADIEALVTESKATFPGLTPWYFVLSTVPLVTSLLAVWGATRHATPSGGIGIWLVIALALLAGAQLHSVFWPSFYGSVLSTTSILRLGAALAVLVGGMLELRSLVRQRDALIAVELERTQRLEDLAQLKADFTSIVAHELANPVAAIKTMSQMVALDDLPDDLRRRTAGDIADEARMLEVLIQDIRETARIERDDFRIDAQRVPVDRLVSDATAYAHRLLDGHQVVVENPAATVTVLADPYRIGQVVRNLLNNAARYTPDGTPIIIRTRRLPGEVAFEVADRGPGIPPKDLARIFEKFERGIGASQSYAGGRGLGLYLSRRIVLGHGSELVAESTPGQGTVFRFTLKEVP